MPGFNIGGSGGGASNVEETSRKHRFLVRIFNPLSTDLLFFARKVVLPALDVDRIVMHHKQEEIYFLGKHRYQQCEINFYRVHDQGGDRAAREIYEWWSSNLLNISTSSLLADDTNGSMRKRSAEIHVLDGTGNTAHKYFLFGLLPQKVSPDTLDASDNSISEISVNLLVDKVREESGTSTRSANPVPCDPVRIQITPPPVFISSPPSPGGVGQEHARICG